jgi:hypothetical protein
LPPTLHEEQTVAESSDGYFDGDLTSDDWGRIHGKAWRDPRFKLLLESDPTAAIKEYVDGQPSLKGKKLRIVQVRPRPRGVDDDFLDDINPFPPSCC